MPAPPVDAPPSAPRRPPRHRHAPEFARLTLIALAALGVLAGAIALGIGTSSEPANPASHRRAGSEQATKARPPVATPRWAANQAFGAALFFLDHYELANGRVARWDQGGDTVSEGEAYAMLLSVAAGDRHRFDAAWLWTRTHLLQPNGLMAWHWANGSITSGESAADADVDAAYALELAASRLHEPADLASATAMAAAIAGNETIGTPSGAVLAAGPWAVGPPAYVNPSYASPWELAALAQLPGQAQTFGALAAGARAVVGQVLGSGNLPPDWVQLTNAVPADVTPQSGSEDLYGFDAVRVPIRWAASCTASERDAAASLWSVLGPAALRGRATIELGLRRGGTQVRGALRSPVGLVAAAASGWASGHRDDALGLLSRAEFLDHAHPSYYTSAWVALGRVFLETGRLGTCPNWTG
jgi:endo-1,4-beta-D-glucanase Y